MVSELRRQFSLSFSAVVPNLFCIFFLPNLSPTFLCQACMLSSFQGMSKRSKSYMYILAIR